MPDSVRQVEGAGLISPEAKMTAAKRLKRINYHLAPHGERIVRCRANDPRWERLGDYYIENIRTGAVPVAFISLREVGTPDLRCELDFIEGIRAERERRERRQAKPK
jgi:hypothetical protein